MSIKRVTRFSGAEWGEELTHVSIIGAGGIGSWLALNISRIGHSITLWDGDEVDQTNVTGGQMYKKSDVGRSKTSSVYQTCRDFGCIASIDAIDSFYAKGYGLTPIIMTGLDNMKARKLVYEEWKSLYKKDKHAILIDGRLTLENLEIITIQGGNAAQMKKYEEEFLFDDSEVEELDCTTKQSTFAAMIIAGMMTATLCNFMTNKKLGVDMRAVPFHQKLFLPIFNHQTVDIEPVVSVSVKAQEAVIN